MILPGAEMVAIEDSVVVVAHPDDEILWFSSILDRCKRVIVCFGHSPTSSEALNSGRIRLMEAYPFSNVEFLRIRQSDAFGAFNWKRPSVKDGQLIFAYANKSYDDNTAKLTSVLAEALENETAVFTHNPWGEYGHEEHVQIFNAVSALHKTMGFELFVNGYVSNRSIPLMSQSFRVGEQLPVAYETKPELAAEIKQLYLDHDCWTWYPDYEWPGVELFYPISRESAPFRRSESAPSSTIPLNYATYNLIPGVSTRIARKIVPASLKPAIKKLLGR